MSGIPSNVLPPVRLFTTPMTPAGGAGISPISSMEGARPKGRPDKAAREKETRREAKERIIEFADTSPSKSEVRKFFQERIDELME
jgi:hypothetical protein